MYQDIHAIGVKADDQIYSVWHRRTEHRDSLVNAFSVPARIAMSSVASLMESTRIIAEVSKKCRASTRIFIRTARAGRTTRVLDFNAHIR